MAQVTARVEGIQVAIRRLDNLDKKARRRIVSAGVRAGMKPVLKAARAESPVRTGGLRASFRVGSVRLNRQTGTVSGEVKVGEKSKRMTKKGLTAYYAHMVHGGSRPHVIKAKRVKALTVGGRFARWVQHPGHRGNPFLQRAASSGFSAAIKAFQDAFAKKLNEEIAK